MERWGGRGDGDAALGCGGDGRRGDGETEEMGMRHWDAEETGMGADGDGEVDVDGCASSVRDREDKPLEIFFPSHRLFPFFYFFIRGVGDRNVMDGRLQYSV